MELQGGERIPGLTWIEKFQALDSLTAASLRVRADGTWYVVWGVEVGERGMLTSYSQAGKTPKDAVEQCWAQHATGQLLILNDMDDRRRQEARWNGFLWSVMKSPPAASTKPTKPS